MIFGVVPLEISVSKPEIAPQAMVMKQKGKSFPATTTPEPSITKFIDGSGVVVAGKLFPFCFITIACGAISGFDTLISSGTTPKIITRESYARTIGQDPHSVVEEKRG